MFFIIPPDGIRRRERKESRFAAEVGIKCQHNLRRKRRYTANRHKHVCRELDTELQTRNSMQPDYKSGCIITMYGNVVLPND